MRFYRLRFILIVLSLAGLGLLLGRAETRPASAAPLLQANLLNNPGLEDPYPSGAPQGWGRWHQELNSNPKPENCSERYLVQPKWSAEFNGALIREGARSAHVGNEFDTWRGGLVQDVAVTAGSTYRFTFLAIGRASNEQFPSPSDTGVNMGVRGGIDPNGSGLWSDADIVWGGTSSPHDSGNQANWQQITVEATATGNTISVFMQADFGGANQCRGHLDVWFDSASLVEAGPPPTATSPPQPTSPPPPPAPVSTNTPVPPTDTPTPEVTPTDTPEPSPTPTDTPVPPMGGTICVNAFADSDADGERSPEEGFMAGVTFTIVQGEQVVTQGVSTGTDNPLCFEELEGGSYRVAQILPRNLETTTAPDTTIEVEEGSSISLEFGSRFETTESEEVAGVPSPTSEGGTADPAGESGSDSEAEDGASDGSGINLLAVAGLGAILVAIGLLGALIFFLVRRGAA
jgi:hypothetical protein